MIIAFPNYIYKSLVSHSEANHPPHGISGFSGTLLYIIQSTKKKSIEKKIHLTTYVSASSFHTGVLEITAALPSHAGRYTCSARNPAGVSHKHITVTVQGRSTETSWLRRRFLTQRANSWSSFRVSPLLPSRRF